MKSQKLSSDKSTEEKKNSRKRPMTKMKMMVMGIVVMAMLICVSVGIFFYVHKNQYSPGMSDNFPGNQHQGEDITIISASGVTSVGMTSDDFEVQNLATKLYVEEVYVSAGSEVKEGTEILKLNEEDVAEAREELETVLKEAELAWRTGTIEYEQSKITAKYDYDMAVLEGKQAQAVYEETIQELEDKVATAKKELDQANEDIAEYQNALANDTYAQEYPYEQLKALYDENLKLLTDKMAEWNVGWEAVTSGRGQGEYVTVLSGLYSVLEQNLKDYEQARDSYDAAVEDANLQLQILQLNLSSLKADLAQAKEEKEEQSLAAKSTLETTQAKAQQADADYETALQKAQSTYDQLQEALEDAQENLTLFEESVGDGYFRASGAGTVVMCNYRAGRNLQSDSMVVAYNSRDDVTVTVSVDQTNIASLEVGDSAMISITNYGTYQGTITEINPVSSSGSRTSVTYNVTVALEGDVSELSANLSATVIFGMGGQPDEKK